MVRYNGPIRVFNPSDGIPTDAAGGGAGGDQTAAALSGMSAQAQAAWQTVDNLSATATTGPVGSGASVTVTGTVPNKTINFTIPRGRDGKDGIGNDAAVQVAMSQQAGTAMRVGVQAGTVGLLVIADSKGAGTGLTNFADRWQNRLAALMRARFPITGGDTMRGLIPANMSDPYNAMSGRPTTTGTTYPVDTAGLGYNALQLELGSTVTWPAATWPAGTHPLPIGYHTHNGASGTLQVLIDGVVQTEINCAGAGEGEPKRTSIPVTAGTHTVSMRPKAGTAPVRVMYAEQRSASTGWHLYDASRPGLAARHVIDRPGAPQGGASFAAAVAQLPGVRLTVVALGANDMTISTPAQYGRDVRAVVDMVKTAHPLTGVVVVLPAALTDDSAVVDDVSAYHTAARAALAGVPDLSVLAETQLVDLTGPNAPAWLADSVHPNAFGHDVIARALAGSLVGLDGPTDALTMVETAAAPAVAAAQSAAADAANAVRDGIAEDLSTPGTPAYEALVDASATVTEPVVKAVVGLKDATNAGGMNVSPSPSAIVGPAADMYHVVQGSTSMPNRIRNANLADVSGYDNDIWDNAIASKVWSHHSVVGGVGGHPTAVGGSYLTVFYGYGSATGTESGVYSANCHVHGYHVSAGALGKTTLAAPATLGATSITVTATTSPNGAISPGHVIFIDYGTKLDRARVASVDGNTLTLDTFQHVSTTNTDGTTFGTGLGQAHAAGTVVYWTQNSRQGGTASGLNADAFGSGATALGDNVEAGATAVLATGKNALGTIYGEQVHASGSPGNVRGGTQMRVIHAFRQITSATPTEVWAGGLARLTLRDHTVWQYHAEVVVKEGGASSRSASWEFKGRIGRGTGAASTSMKSGPSVVTYDADYGADGWTATVSADTATGSLRISVGGEAGSTLTATAVVSVTEISG